MLYAWHSISAVGNESVFQAVVVRYTHGGMEDGGSVFCSTGRKQKTDARSGGFFFVPCELENILHILHILHILLLLYSFLSVLVRISKRNLWRIYGGYMEVRHILHKTSMRSCVEGAGILRVGSVVCSAVFLRWVCGILVVEPFRDSWVGGGGVPKKSGWHFLSPPYNNLLSSEELA